MSINILVFNAAIRHQIYLLRYAGGQANQLKKDLISIKNQVLKELQNKSLSLSRKQDREKMLVKLNKLINSSFGVTEKSLENSLKGLAEYEAGFYKRLIDANINTPLAEVKKRKLDDAVFKKAFQFSETERMTISDSINAFTSQKKKQMLQTVKDGFVNGVGIPDIAKSINEITQTRFAYQAQALARTLVQQVAVHARNALYDENTDIVENMRWVSVLDSRTTPECQALDGEILPIDSKIQPGFHWNCRSTTVPVIKNKYNIVSDAKVERAARGEDGKTESVDGRVTYNSWLKTQPKEFQEDVLGVTKAKLFREGGLNLTKFVDENYRPLTIEELKNSDDADIKRAFNKIGGA